MKVSRAADLSGNSDYKLPFCENGSISIISFTDYTVIFVCLQTLDDTSMRHSGQYKTVFIGKVHYSHEYIVGNCTWSLGPKWSLNIKLY